MIYKSKIEIEGVIVITILLSCLSVLAYFISKSLVLGIISFVTSISFSLSFLKQAIFYMDYLKINNLFLKKSTQIRYSDITKITLFYQGNIRFESNPSLIIFYRYNSKLKTKEIVVNNDSKLIDLLTYLHHEKKIRIVKDSKLKSHQNIKI